MSDAQVCRLAAKGFAENHLRELAADILAWRARSKIPEGSKMHGLAELCAGYCSADDQYQEAERLVVTKTLEHAAGVLQQPTSDTERKAAKALDKEFTPDDWIGAGYRRLESNKWMKPNEAFMLEKSVTDTGTGRVRYTIAVGVYDYSELPKAPTKWGFSPTVRFNRSATMEIGIFTNDPAAAEAEIDAAWVALGSPYSDCTV